MIEVRSLRKSFGQLEVLKGIDFRVGAGETTAILGPNGSGKSTLVKCILGLCHPDEGSIVVGAEAVDRVGRHKKIIGYMPQKASFPDNLTGQQVLDLIVELRSQDIRPDFDLVKELAFEEELPKLVKTLSGGTRQKISAAIALAFKPKVLFLDEPTAGLDPVSSGIFKDHIARRAEEGCTVVITSHILNDIEELSANIMYLLEGTLVFHGTIEALKSQTGERTLERAIATLTLRAQRHNSFEVSS